MWIPKFFFCYSTRVLAVRILSLSGNIWNILIWRFRGDYDKKNCLIRKKIKTEGMPKGNWSPDEKADSWNRHTISGKSGHKLCYLWKLITLPFQIRNGSDSTRRRPTPLRDVGREKNHEIQKILISIKIPKLGTRNNRRTAFKISALERE